MSNKATDEPECQAVTKAESAEKFGIFENTMKPSKEFLQVLESLQTLSTASSKSVNKQIKIIESKLDELFDEVTNTKDKQFDNNVILANAYLHLYRVYTKSNAAGNVHVGRHFIARCLNLTSGEELNSKCILAVLEAYNHLGSLFLKQEETENAITAYNKSAEFYLKYMIENDKTDNLIDFHEIITKQSANIDGYKKLFTIYSFSLQALLEVYTYLMPNNTQEIIKYRHVLLKIEYDRLPETRRYLHWIESAMVLCEYLLINNRFKEIENHIIVANHVKEACNKAYVNMALCHDCQQCDKGFKDLISLEKSALCSQSHIANMLINLFRAKYEIEFLYRSIEHFLQSGNDEDFCAIYSESNPQALLLFTEEENIDANMSIFSPMLVNYTLNYTNAKNMFHRIWIRIMNLNMNVRPGMMLKIQIHIILTMCKAYKYMALYEKDVASRNCLLTQRASILFKAASLISPGNYNVFKYFRLQLAFTYLALADIKVNELEANNTIYMSERRIAINNEIDGLIRSSVQILRFCI